MVLAATYLGANGWWLEFGDLRVLVDPWLEGPLTFAPGGWLFRGELPGPRVLPGSPHLLLLSQGLPDHCHPPSLARLERDLPVVGSAAAAARVRRLGFRRVTALAPGQSHSVQELRITATAGAPVPQVENGYLLEHQEGRLYLEPHGFLPEDLAPPPLDAVITPVVDLGLPLLGTFVKGSEVLPLLLPRLRPATVLASTTGGAVRFTGLLPALLRQRGAMAEADAVVAAHAAATGDSCRFIDPEPGRRYLLEAR
jgi:L-ascorbate metabolism protein UlaG (beta-lactamase superfamily)